MTISVLLANDHPVERRGLRNLLESEPDLAVVGETHDNLEAVRLTERLQPHVLILTIPALSGLDTLRLVREVAPQTQAVVLSQFKNSALVIEAMKSGATGYVLKRCSEENLVRAVRAAAKGTRFFSPPVKASLEQIDQDRQESLTPREREVLRQAALGSTSQQIGERLHISPRTVESHRSHLLHKLGLRNHSELVLYAVRLGLIPLED
jgi:two-component system, NarL family, response regulator NreC